MNADLVYLLLTRAQLGARCRDLRDRPGLPHAFDLDQYGELMEVTPLPQTQHQRIVNSLQLQIAAALGGEALPGVGVLTSLGVRIPDVVWQAHWSSMDPASPAPWSASGGVPKCIKHNG